MNKLIILLFIGISVQSTGQSKFNAGERTNIFYDSSRSRLLKTEIWYPTPEIDSSGSRKTDLPFMLDPTIRNASILSGKHPLILLSHGTGGNRFGLAWLAIALAQQGYIVAAPDHWGNTYDNKIPEYFVRSWERPLDIRFILTLLLRSPEYQPFIDETRIGAAGFSLGGYTVVALAGGQADYPALQAFSKTPQGRKEHTVPELGDLTRYSNEAAIGQGYKEHRNLKDERIRTFIALAPALGQGFPGEEQVRGISDPILFIGAEDDQIAPVETNAAHYHRLISHSEYIEIKGGAGHYVFLNEGNASMKKEVKYAYKDPTGVNRNQIHQQVIRIAIGYFAASFDKTK